MNEELLFHVEGNVASRATRLSLADAGLREREHLQEWILANPDIIGEDILVITAEFDRWLPNAVSRSNKAVRDRLDVLGLDATGQLVVAELKRDRAADTVEMQAIKYAAMVSQFTPDLLAQAFATHLSARGEPTMHADARRALEDHAGGALDLKVLRRPRIVLIAGEFLDTTTTSAVWLTQMGVEVDLVRYQAYRTPGGLVVTTSKIWPLDEAEDLVVRPEEREEVEETQRERCRSRSPGCHTGAWWFGSSKRSSFPMARRCPSRSRPASSVGPYVRTSKTGSRRTRSGGWLDGSTQTPAA
jgi:hypothetical protein